MAQQPFAPFRITDTSTPDQINRLVDQLSRAFLDIQTQVLVLKTAITAISGGAGLEAPVTNAELQTMADSTLKGRHRGGGIGQPEDLTPAQAKDLLQIIPGDIIGFDEFVVPQPTNNSLQVATTGPGTIATDFRAGDVIDGWTLTGGRGILIKDQADPTENGLYDINTGSPPTRTADTLQNIAVYIDNGTLHGQKTFMCVSPPTITPGTTPLYFTQCPTGILTTVGGLTGNDVGLYVGGNWLLDLMGEYVRARVRFDADNGDTRCPGVAFWRGTSTIFGPSSGMSYGADGASVSISTDGIERQRISEVQHRLWTRLMLKQGASIGSAISLLLPGDGNSFPISDTANNLQGIQTVTDRTTAGNQIVLILPTGATVKHNAATGSDQPFILRGATDLTTTGLYLLHLLLVDGIGWVEFP